MKPKNLEAIYRLSPLQEGILFHALYEPDTSVYYMQFAFALRGELDPAVFRQAWQSVVDRHAALRTELHWEGLEKPVQVVRKQVSLPWEELDWRGTPGEELAARWESLLRADRGRRFDLSQAPLMRVTLVRTAEREHRFLWSCHHVVIDGWGFGVIVRDLFTFYEAHLQRRPAQLEPVRPYRDYIAWLQQQDPAASEPFWRAALGGLDAPTPVGPERPGGAEEAPQEPREVAVRLSRDTTAAVTALARRHRLTPSNLFQAAWGLLLGRYAARDEVVFGVTVSGRSAPLPGIESMVGLFINTLPLALPVPAAAPVEPWLADLRDRHAGLLQHEHAPLVQVQAWSGVPRGLPLFESILVYENYPVDAALAQEIGRRVPVEPEVLAGFSQDNYPLALVVLPSEDLLLRLQYDPRRFEGSEMARRLAHVERLLLGLVAGAARRLGDLPLLSESERRQVLEGWNDTAMALPPRTLHELVLTQVERSPEAVAVESEDGALTYAELARRAAALAARLQALGAGPETPVGIALDRSPEMVVALLGVLQAGGAYLPLDPEYPRERLATLVVDARPVAVVDRALLEELEDAMPAPAAVSPDNLVSILYTSGSTGVPKGVMSVHAGLVSRFLWAQEVDPLRPSDRVLQSASFSFDFAVWECLAPLMVGARVVLPRPGGHRDSAYLARLVAEHGVTVAHFVPSMLRVFLEEPAVERCGALRLVMAGGEALTADLRERFFERFPAGVELRNQYGPTETSIDIMCQVCRPGPGLPVEPLGQPVWNTRVYVLDPELRPMPEGVAGELCVAGTSLARGYLGRPHLTAERFQPNPFGAPGERLYRTGDLARRLPDGTLEFLGRIDHQVKVRGFRIEPGEVEAALAALPDVRQAVVAARGEGAGRRLVAYVVAGAGATEDDLRAALRERLPEHMVPSLWFLLPELPHLPSGKVDRRALERLEVQAPAAGDATAPRTPLEDVIAGIWQEVLGLDRIGIHDSFFDLGGHSLLATQVISRVRSVLAIEVPLRALFDAPTVAGLAAVAEAGLRTGAPLAVRAAPRAEGGAPLSFAQQRLWFLDQLEPESASYNIPTALLLRGPLDLPALEASLAEIVRRHEVLRTRYAAAAGEPVQIADVAVPERIPQVDLAALPPETRRGASLRLAAEEARRPFDLARGPVLRAALLRLEPEEHLALFTVHHIASDAWSTGILVRELGALYDAFTTGRPSPLPPLPLQYADFARWQREQLQGEVLAALLGHWRERLAGAPPVLELPTDHPRPPRTGGLAGSRSLHIPPGVTEAARALARRRGASLYMVLLAVFDLALSRWTGQSNLTVGTPIANRNRREIEGLIGFFVNTLVLRADLERPATFQDLLVQVRETTLAAYAHQDLPFERLVEELAPERGLGTTPLFQAMFSLQNTPVQDLRLRGLTLAPFEGEAPAARFDLSLGLIEDEDRLLAALLFRRELFEEATIDRLLGHYATLLAATVADPSGDLVTLPLLSDQEREQVLEGWNDTTVEVPSVPLHALVLAQAERTPDAVAVESEAGNLTYAELARRAAELAARLRELGAGPEAPVGIALERSPQMLVSLLAVLQAGSAYLPLDPESPAERLAALLADARPVAVIRENGLQALEGGRGLQGEVGPESLASILYTSGSTGVPKGVMSVHGGLVNRFLWAQSAYPLQPSDRVLQSASFSFDFALWECLAPLLAGARVVLAQPGGHRDSAYLARLIAERGVTVAHFVPSLLRVFLEEPAVEHCASLRLVLVGGEALTADLRERFFARLPHAELRNQYGPTEASIDVSCQLCQPGEGRPIEPLGEPVWNTRLYVVDPGLQPVPVGVAGELCVAGRNLARGYLGRPDRTAERFVPDPFGAPRERLYRTGDLARWRSDGNLEILGRIDHQVKVRGFRIEPGEVEAALIALPGVRQAAVAAVGAGASRRLAAYVVAGEGATENGLRAALRERLPEHMVPSVWLLLPALPLLPSGKVDRRALARLEVQPPAAAEAAAPRTPLEEVIAGIWQEVLGRDRIGIHDSFFDLGGHSLLATQVISRLRSALAIEVPLRALFDAPTVAGLAAVSEEGLRTGAPLAVRAAPHTEGGAPLSFAQQRLWFLDQLEPESASYNIPTALLLLGPLDLPALEASLAEIVRRHEVLRTRFAAAAGEPVQIADVAVPERIPQVDLTALPPEARHDASLRLAAEEARRPFDLARGPVLRAALLRLEPEEHLALFTVHHIASDAWSTGILVRELGALYDAFTTSRPSPLPPLPLQYADFARWQREQLQGEVLAALLGHWRERLAGAPPVLELPTDHPRPPRTGGPAGARSLHIPPGVAEAARALARRHGASLYMVLLAVFDLALSRWTGQTDLTVGTPIANRNRREIEGLIGFFVNTLVLRADLERPATFQELFLQVRETTLTAYAHQDLPFERLVEELAPERALGTTPLFQAMFSLQNAPAGDLRLRGLTLVPFEGEGLSARFDLSLGLIEDEARLLASFLYRGELFEEATIDRLLGHYATLLAAAVTDPSGDLVTLPLLSDQEREQVLEEWNDTAVEVPSVPLHALVLAQAERTPEAVAVESEAGNLTYAELARRAAELAARLRELGAGPEAPVGIALERSPQMLVSLLAVLQAGSAYLPLDPEYPAERLAALLADARPVAVIREDGLQALEGGRGLQGELGPESLASILYTSGSTGVPKGVMSVHGGLVNRFLWAQSAYPLQPSDRVLQSASFSFDFALWECLAPLLAGARVVLARPGGHRDSAYLARLIAERGVTVAHFVPSLLRVFLEEPAVERCASLRLVLVGGEALTADLRERFFARLPHAELHNQYGPTEASIDVTERLCRPGGEARPVEPLGRPIANVRLLVVDRALRLAPVGVAGELCLAGRALARGYLGRPDLTAERFVPEPFGGRPGERMYRTGDRARWLPGGEVEILGRLDFQVKIRGFRIEPEEIEAALTALPGVLQAAVLPVGEGTTRRLAAYVAAAPDAGPLDPHALREGLRRTLPDPMIPAAWAVLPALPLLPTGKVDRRALAAIDPGHAFGEADGAPGSPGSPVEEMVAAIWSDVLGLGRSPGARDDFFALGGHSLLATQVVSRLRETFGVEVPLRALFEAPTVAGVAERVEQARREGAGIAAPPLVPVDRGERDGLPLSFAQQRLWFLAQIAPDSPFYNIAGGFRLTGPLDLAALRAAFCEIVRRHESLRTTFHAAGGPPVQRIDPEPRVGLPLVDLGALPEGERRAELRRLAAGHAAWPFDLTRGPLIRLLLIRLADQEHSLLHNVHHIVSDGWSTGVLFRELTALYEAFLDGQPAPLPPLPVQYADFAVWQRRWLSGAVLEAELEHWRRQLDGAPGTLDLPLDRPRPAFESFRGASVAFQLPAGLVRRLRHLTRERGATLSMTLLAGFKALLARAARQDDLALGVAVANRNRREIEGLIGFFVNTLVLRTRLGDGPGFGELLGRVRETSLEAYLHQDLPFEKLVEELQPERSLARNPLIQVMCGFQNFPRASALVRGLEVSLPPEELGDAGTSKFDLTLFVLEAGEEARGSLSYSTDLFDRATIRRLLRHYEAFLAAAVDDPAAPVGELPLLAEEERHQLAREWNDTASVYPAAGLAGLFAAQVRRTPEAPALLSASGVLSYAGLDRRANRLAHRLRALGVGLETRVGLCLERSPELVVGALAVLKAGGAYVPLDPGAPRERLAFVLESAEVRAVVAVPETAAKLPDLPGLPVLDVQEEEGDDTALPSVADGDSLAYVMYTSGSTGRPKGVAVPQRAVARLVLGTEYIRFGPDQAFLLLAPASFDASTLEIWGPLLHGGRLAIAPPGTLSLEEIAAEVERWSVTTLWLTGSLFNQMVDGPVAGLRGVRQLLTGGEALSAPHALRALDALPETRLINGYGPTESTTFAATQAVERGELLERAPSLGRPIASTRVHLLDPHGQPVPLGHAGELCIAGDGLARGYLGRPDLTAERFVPDPFGAPGERLYRSGDLARQLPDGRLQFLGRLDQQVKVRGFRIEPGEIEARLLEHPAVRRAVVVAREDVPGDRRLVAYIEQDAGFLPAAGEGDGEGEEQVGQWEMLFDDLYRREAADPDPTFNIVGWESTYTGHPLPRREMEVWLEDTVGRIRSLAPRRVLEIGCGTGMLLFRLAPRCERYVGTDVSAEALAYVEAQLPRLALDRSRVALLHRPADRLEGLEEAAFDTVILNSVVQYFPSADYLADVLTGAVRLVRPGGSLFLGDVRSLPLLEAFHVSVELFQAADDLPLPVLRQRAQARRLEENELTLDPAFFAELRRRVPRITRVEIHPKRGAAHNELTRFRYQVVLRVEEPAPALPAAVWLDAERDGVRLETLRELLEGADGPAVVGVRNLRDARVAEDLIAARLLADGEGDRATAGVLRRAAREAVVAAEAAIDPQDLWDLERELPWDVELGWGEAGRFHAVLRRRGTAAPLPALLPPWTTAALPRSWSDFANNPLQGRFARRLAPELRALCAAALPDFMIPSAFVLLDALPLNPNGKVDRRRLPAPGLPRLEAGARFVPPRTPVEERVARIWGELLGLDGAGGRIGVEDDFFALGGHSLLATQAVSRIAEAFEVALPLRAFFEASTVAGVAREIEARLREAGSDGAPPLVPVPRGERLPLSFAQERLWFLHQLGAGPAYSEVASFRVRGPLDAAAWRWSLDRIVQRHESLRTTFPEWAGRAEQRIAEADGAAFPLLWVDLRELPEATAEDEARRLAWEQARQPYDLARGPLVRGLLVRLGAADHAALFSFHHIVFDGWSMGVFARELSALYAARVAGEEAALAALPVQYADFAVWQRSWLQGEVLESHLAWWRQRLAGAAPLELPTDRPRRPVPPVRGGSRELEIGGETLRGLRALAQRHGATAFMVLLAVFQALLRRYTAEDDVSVGAPVANRNRVEVEPLLGFFVNVVVLRTDLSGDPSFHALLERVREGALGAFAHQDLPFERLVEELRPERDLQRNPFFQVTLQVLNTPRRGLELPGVELLPFDTGARPVKLDLEAGFFEREEALTGAVSYDAELFDAPTIERLLGHFERLLRSALADPGRPLSDLALLTPAEEHQLVREQAGPAVPADLETPVHERFAALAAHRPEALAVGGSAGSLTYGELDHAAERLARRLRRLGVGPEVLVGLCLDRSPALVVAVLATWKAGGAYVPIDPASPRDRISFLVEDAATPVLLTEERFRDRLPAGRATVVCLDRDVAEEPGDAAGPRATAAHLAYAIYTSGSTGRPKAVLVEHGSLAHLVDWHHAAFALTVSDRTLLLASPSFDASVWEIATTLSVGASLHILPDELRADPGRLAAWMAEAGITLTEMTTPLAEALIAGKMPEGMALRALLVGGERLQRPPREGLPFVLVNNYGPTEGTILVTSAPIPPGPPGLVPPPIGRPIDRAAIAVLDCDGREAPLGVPGELCIGGVGVARGYLRRPELTAERFVPDPWGAPGARRYRSGDLARWRPDGQLDFLGRIDHQVKVRGFRVELGEIETVLAGHPGVREAAVALRGRGSDARLVAYIVPQAGETASLGSALRDHLRERLPEHAVPAAFVLLEALPWTRHGKIDRSALPEPEIAGESAAAPRTPVEELLVGLWQQVLRAGRAGVEDSFFDLGGHSLLAIRLIARVRETFGVEMPLRALFESPTPAGFAVAVERALQADRGRLAPPILRVGPAERERGLPLSFPQQRLWIVDRLEPGLTAYNMPFPIRLEGDLDATALEAGLGAVLRRHEVLRTRFEPAGGPDGGPVQVVLPDAPFHLPQVDLGALPPARREAEAERLTAEESLRPFDLERGPLLRTALLRLAAADHVLLLTFHHIASDGASLEIFARELMAPTDLPALPVQYADYAVWQRSWLQGAVLDELLAWWRERLAGLAPLELPTDRPRPARPSFRGGRIAVQVAPETAAALAALGRRRGATPFMVLLGAFQALLARLSGQTDVVVGTPSANRDRREIEGLIGFFVNLLVLRTEVDGALPFAELLDRARETALGAYAHRDLPFERLVEEMSPGRDLGRNPLFQVAVQLLRADAPLPAPTGVRLLRAGGATGVGGGARFDLDLSLRDTGSGFAGTLEFSRDLFDAPTAARLARHLAVLLEGIAADPGTPVAALPLLSAEEAHHLRAEWNDVRSALPPVRTIPEAFAAALARTPEAVALEFGEETLTYRELDERANRLARRLRALGVGRGGADTFRPGVGSGNAGDAPTGLHPVRTSGASWGVSTERIPRSPNAAEHPGSSSVETPQSASDDLPGATPSGRLQPPDADNVDRQPGNLLVGVCLERSADLVVALLAILRAGGAYLPLDPSYPTERLAFLLTDAGAPVVLTRGDLLAALPAGERTVLRLDTDPWLEESPQPLAVSSDPDSLAYVIYTSGSTGVPKGVAVPHRAVLRLVLATDYAQLGPEDRVAQASNASFDAATWEIWGALLNGGRLVGVSRDVTLSPRALATELREKGITALFLTTALFHQIAREAPDAFAPLRHLLFGGEAIDPAAVRRVLAAAPPERLLHVYGPTENTTFTSWYRVKGVTEVPPEARTVPIGRPIANTRIAVLDADLRPVPPGVTGELLTGGAGLARGYLGRPDLTAERFIPDPEGPPGSRLYRTGDLVRRRPDGAIEFLGRADQQVKIRGFRIEPGEIEAVLLTHPAVREAVVLAREESPGERRLLAWVVLAPDADLPSPRSALRAWLQERLPEHMIPAAFTPLEALPLTPNRKIDRAALPAPDFGDTEGLAPEEPRSPTEEILLGLWAELFGRERIGPRDDFFELGGHSLLAVQLISRVRRAFGVEVPLRALFEEPTVRGFGAEVDRALRAGWQVEAPPIVPVGRDEPLPLSYAQQRLWMLDQLQMGSPAYNMPLAVRLTGDLDVAVLEAVLVEVVRRHEALRTTFGWRDGEPVQILLPFVEPELPRADLGGLPAEERWNEAVRTVRAEGLRPFDLEWDALVRLLLLRLSPDDHLLLVTMHHIVSDGWSMGVLLREISALYRAFSAGRPSPLPELPVQYADFAVWQRHWLQGEVLERQLAWWRQVLQGAPVLELPTDRPRRALETHAGAVRSAWLPAATTAALSALDRAEGATLFMSLLTAWKLLLGRHAGQPDVVVGTPIANRNREEIEGLIGFFVNTLVLRTPLDGDPTGREALQRVRETMLGAYAHQDLPFQKLVEELQPRRDLQRSPFFQVLFILQNAPREAEPLPGVAITQVSLPSTTAKFELTLALTEGEAGLAAVMEYNTDLFDAATIDRMLRHFATLARGLAEAPDRPVSELPMLSAAERHQMASEWNDTRRALPAGATVHRLFEETVAAAPDAPAVLFADGRLTYGELDRRANRLARQLRRLGVGPEVPVGVFLERSPELIVSFLAVLKAGGAYMPLDVAYPLDRLTYMLVDSRASVVLTRQAYQETLPAGHGLTLVPVDAPADPHAADSDESLPGAALAEGLAYIMYTSGSTGRPKGVAVTHEGIVRLVREAGFFSVTPQDVFLQTTALSFDVSTFEIWGSLLNGAALALPITPSPTLEELGASISRFGVTVLWLTSGLFGLMVDRRMEDLRPVRQFLAGGDVVPVPQARRVLEELPGCRLINGYGPTENTTFTACHTVRLADADRPSIPIGRPLGNTTVHLLDRGFRPVAVGVRGELCTGGLGVARGYLGRPDLTAERFIPDPSGGPGERLYRTGDLARWLPDGTLEFLGRIDTQVKIRGIRIELDEVQSVLGRHPAVAESVVLAREDRPGERRLVAYVVPARETSQGELQAFLLQSLPDAMVPSAFVLLEALPLTPNGKVDRRALPAPEDTRREAQASYAPPRNELERRIAEIWSEVLNVERVGIFDNFFDLGGHSLLLLRAVSRLGEALGVQLSRGLLFEHPTVASLAAHLGASGAAGPAEAEPAAGAPAARVEKGQERAAARRESLRRRQEAPPRAGRGRGPEGDEP